MTAVLQRIWQALPGNILGSDVAERVERLAEEYDRLRTERLECERILDRAGVPRDARLSARVEALRLRLAER